MSYCPPNISLSDVWINNGTSVCFMDTVTTSITFGFLLVFGTIQLLMYRKYGTEVSSNQLPKSRLYGLQIFLAFVVPLLAVVRFILEAVVFEDHHIYIYMVSRGFKFFYLLSCARRLFIFIDSYADDDDVVVSLFRSDYAYGTEVSTSVRSNTGTRISFAFILDDGFYIGKSIVFKSWTETMVVST